MGIRIFDLTKLPSLVMLECLVMCIVVMVVVVYLSSTFILLI